MNNHDINYAATKAGTGIGAAGIAGLSPSDIASYLAALYTILLLGEWLWKKVIRPFMMRRGWIAPPKRRRDDDAKS